MNKKPAVLMILDGYGIGKKDEHDAVHMANTPNMDSYFKNYSNTSIGASGYDVGLPNGQMGNSEVGHLNIGAGRVINQPLVRVSKSIEEGDFFTNPAFLKATDNVKKNNSSLHLMGLVSDGGVHSHLSHLVAFIELAKKEGLEQVYVHCYMDGRDVPPSSGLGFIKDLEAEMDKMNFGKIATIAGRFYAMDRDNIWEREKIAYDALVSGIGVTADSSVEAMQNSYDKGETDEFVMPTVILSDGQPTAVIKENDSVIFFNFRPDRSRQLTRAFTEPDFDGFEHTYFPTTFVTLTQYDVTFKNVEVGYMPLSYENTFGEYLAKKGLTQLRIAETQKYPHVTYFFNGGVEKPNKGEERVLIDSPKIATFDAKPEMSAYEVTDAVLAEIAKDKFDVIVINYANCDMVGHTGIFEAAVKAVEAVDECVGRVVEAVLAAGGDLLITADHGNADKMWDDVDDQPFTAHTVNPVPLIVVSEKFKDAALKSGGVLGDIVPTLMKMMGLEQPEEMTGKSLI